MSPAPDRYAVIGHPVDHSRSPDIHRLFAEQCGQTHGIHPSAGPDRRLRTGRERILRRRRRRIERHAAVQAGCGRTGGPVDRTGAPGRRGEHADGQRRRSARRQHRRRRPGCRSGRQPGRRARRSSCAHPRRRRRGARRRAESPGRRGGTHHDRQSQHGQGARDRRCLCGHGRSLGLRARRSRPTTPTW